MRFDGEALHAMIGCIYDSVAEPGAMGPVLGEIADSFGAHSAIMFSPALPPEHGGLSVMHNHDPVAIERYRDYYSGLDLWYLAGQARARGGPMGIVTGAELVPRAVFETSEFYNDFLKPLDTYHVIATDIEVKTPVRRVTVSLAFHAGPRHKGFGAAEKAVLATLVPHLRGAAQLAARLGNALDGMRFAVDVLENLGDGVLLLAADGEVLHATSVARAMLGAESGLRLRNGRLVAALARDNAELANVLSRAAGRTGVPCAGTLALHSTRAATQPLVISAFPLPHRTPLFATDHPARVLVTVRDPARTPATHWDVFARHFGITPAELRLCQALAADVPLPEYCAQQGLSENTARSQLKSVFGKTGAQRQSELLRLLQAFG